MVQDDDDDYSASGGEAEGDPEGREEDSGDELMMNPRQEVYGGIHPVQQPAPRLKRVANAPNQQAEASPTKRRRVSDTARAKAPAKKK
ncbi:hypothetical protein K438DRAFT_1860720 [Mycena galopus ATCC 62051]|nr:hypothetical protein K438DRAFT_1860720 [Mycena galopus ATCC 62051]